MNNYIYYNDILTTKTEIIALPVSDVSDDIFSTNSRNYHWNKVYTKTHNDGWTITAKIEAEYEYLWVEVFEATHETYGKVYGDFNDKVYCTSKEAYDDFIENHPVYIMNYNF